MLDFDFHIVWDGANSLINVDQNEEDADGSPLDYGIYGRDLGDDWVDEENEWEIVTWDDGHFVVLGPGDIAENNLTIPQSDYRMYTDFLVPENQEYTIEAGAELSSYAEITFEVEGELRTDGDDGSEIVFKNGDSEWEGIYLDEPEDDTTLDYVNIQGVSENFQGIMIHGSEGCINISNCAITNCGMGMSLIGLEANEEPPIREVLITSCSLTDCDDYAMYMEDVDADVVYMKDTECCNSSGSGIELLRSHPNVDEDDEEEASSKFNVNTDYGMMCDESNPKFNHPDHGNSEFRDNDDSQIFLTDESYPEINQADADIERNGQGLCIEWGE